MQVRRHSKLQSSAWHGATATAINVYDKCRPQILSCHCQLPRMKPNQQQLLAFMKQLVTTLYSMRAIDAASWIGNYKMLKTSLSLDRWATLYRFKSSIWVLDYRQILRRTSGRRKMDMEGMEVYCIWTVGPLYCTVLRTQLSRKATLLESFGCCSTKSKESVLMWKPPHIQKFVLVLWVCLQIVKYKILQMLTHICCAWRPRVLAMLSKMWIGIHSWV